MPPSGFGESRTELRDLLIERSFRLGDFILASGARSSYYVDCRTTTMHGRGQILIGKIGLGAIQEAKLEPDAVGGLTMGADPISYAIASESWRQGGGLNAFSVRKEAKGHGKGRQIEGCFEAGMPVVVVEDVITTGGSALKACEAVQGQGGDILAVLGLVDREEGGRATLEREGYRTIALYTAGELTTYGGVSRT